MSDGKHAEDCRCPRCEGFAEGNEWRVGEGNALAVRHGAYAVMQLSEAAAPIVEVIRDLLPVGAPCDEPVVQLLGVTLEQVRRATTAIEAATENGRRGDVLRLSLDAQGWVKRAADLAEMLGMTPRSRARLGLDLAQLADRRSPLDYDVEKLDADERKQLTALVRKAAVDE